MKKILMTIGTLAMALVLASVGTACSSGDGEGQQEETIVFSDLNWTSPQVQNRIAQYIVEHGYGYPTDVIFGGDDTELPGSAKW